MDFPVCRSAMETVLLATEIIWFLVHVQNTKFGYVWLLATSTRTQQLYICLRANYFRKSCYFRPWLAADKSVLITSLRLRSESFLRQRLREQGVPGNFKHKEWKLLLLLGFSLNWIQIFPQLIHQLDSLSVVCIYFDSRRLP